MNEWNSGQQWCRGDRERDREEEEEEQEEEEEVEKIKGMNE